MAANQSEVQILALAKQGLCVEEIATSLGFDQETVGYVLARNGKLEADEVSDGDFERIRSRMIDIAKHSEDDILAARVGMFLWERKKGSAKDLKSAPVINVNKLNMMIAGANNFVDTFRNNLKQQRATSHAIECPTTNSQTADGNNNGTPRSDKEGKIEQVAVGEPLP